MDYITISTAQFIVELAVFIFLTLIGINIRKRILNSSNRYLNPLEFLPEDEVHTLKQVFYLILMAACFINALYGLTFDDNDLIFFVVFDILLSLYVAIDLDKSSLKNKILYFLLIPFGSMSIIMFNTPLIISMYNFGSYLDFIHIPMFLYFVKVYFDKFRDYTESNGLGIAIILLFIIIFINFLITQFAEGVSPLDSLVMVSNAFTSNGYAVLGNTLPGKINSLFLVWGGYIISGAGTATLTAAILIRQFNKRIKKLEKIIEEEVVTDDDN